MLQAVFIHKNTTEGAKRTVRLLPMTYFNSVLEVIVKKNYIEVVDILVPLLPTMLLYCGIFLPRWSYLPPRLRNWNKYLVHQEMFGEGIS